MVRLAAIVNLLLAASLGAAAAGEAHPVRIVAFGDSLTAGYGLAPGEAFPAQLAKALEAKGVAAEIANAGVSGDTTAAGLGRLDWAVPEGTDAVIVELGANDALRGIDPHMTKDNLDKIISRIKDKGADILLAGMKAPGNWGPEYQATFDVIYPELAGKHNLPLYPFFLEGVIGQDELTMDDGLHPTTKGVAELVKRILPDVEALLKRIGERKAAAAAAKP